MQPLQAVVNLKTVCENARVLASAWKKPIIAVVKDDAYGHGALRVAHALCGIAQAFAVATVEEGAALRLGGISQPILVLTPPLTQEEALRIVAHELIATISSVRTLRLFPEGEPFEAHIAVNTGMNRYGVRPEVLESLLREANAREIRVTGVYSHLYEPSLSVARREQTMLFRKACKVVKRYYPEAVRHLSATGGALAGDDFDAIRAGIALYGYLPDGFEGALPVRPAMKIYATVAESRSQLGGGIGYKRAKARSQKLYTLRVGYGDGFFREGGLGAVGKLCMDACVCEGNARAGSRRLILSDAAEYAGQHGTTAYEVLVNVTKRANMEYIV